MVDGKERMIIIEGLAEGAMQRIEGIALQALTGALPQPNATCRRAVHWHQGLRYYSTLPKTVPSDWTVRNITAWTWSNVCTSYVCACQTRPCNPDRACVMLRHGNAWWQVT